MTTRQEIARIAIEEIWDAQAKGKPIMDQQSLADAVGVDRGETVGNALTAFGDKACDEHVVVHPDGSRTRLRGYTWIYSPRNGYRITERIDSYEIKQVRGKLKTAATKIGVSAAKFSARRNSLPLREAVKELLKLQVGADAVVDGLERVIADEERREARKLAAQKVGRRKV